MPPHRFRTFRLAHSSHSSAIVLLGVIGYIAIVSLTRYATDAVASFPSTVIRRLLPMSDSSSVDAPAQTCAWVSPRTAPVWRAMISSSFVGITHADTRL